MFWLHSTYTTLIVFELIELVMESRNRKSILGDHKKRNVLQESQKNTTENIGKGICGDITGNKTTVYKNYKYTNTYWVNEMSIYKYMEKSNHPCVMKPDRVEFMADRVVCEMKRYVRDLEDYRIMSEYHMLVFLLQMSSAIKFIHGHKIIHRDIKPANILMDSSGNFVLTDFSHSVVESCISTSFYPTVTSYPYRAPEVFKYQCAENEIECTKNFATNNMAIDVTNATTNITEYDEKIDVWSFGAIFLELICQLRFDLLFTNKSCEETMCNIVCSPVFCKKLDDVCNNNIYNFMNLQPSSVSYKEILKNTLCQDPKKRWSSRYLHAYVVELCKLSRYSEHLKPLVSEIILPKRQNYTGTTSIIQKYDTTLLKNIQNNDTNTQKYDNVSLLDEENTTKKNFLILSKDIRTNGLCKYHFIAAYQIIQILTTKKFLNKNEDHEKLVACAIFLDTIFFDKIHVLFGISNLNKTSETKVSKYLVELYELVKDDIFTSSYFDFNLTI